jgi:hypothetical protein
MKDNIKNNAYVYLHRRLDTNEVFYIGIGTQKNFKRAYDKKRRSSFWKYVTNKVSYVIDIIYKNISLDKALYYEINLIAMYGRRDLNKGKLVNLTNGGESNKGIVYSDQYKKNMSIVCRGKIVSEETKKKLTIAGKKRYEKSLENKVLFIRKRKKYSEEILKKTGDAHKKLILNIQTGIFYYGIKEASDSCNIPYKRLGNYLSSYRNNISNFIYC